MSEGEFHGGDAETDDWRDGERKADRQTGTRGRETDMDRRKGGRRESRGGELIVGGGSGREVEEDNVDGFGIERVDGAGSPV